MQSSSESVNAWFLRKLLLTFQDMLLGHITAEIISHQENKIVGISYKLIMRYGGDIRNNLNILCACVLRLGVH